MPGQFAAVSTTLVCFLHSGAGQTLRHVQRDHDNVWEAMVSYQVASVNHIEMFPKEWGDRASVPRTEPVHGWLMLNTQLVFSEPRARKSH